MAWKPAVAVAFLVAGATVNAEEGSLVDSEFDSGRSLQSYSRWNHKFRGASGRHSSLRKHFSKRTSHRRPHYRISKKYGYGHPDENNEEDKYSDGEDELDSGYETDKGEVETPEKQSYGGWHYKPKRVVKKFSYYPSSKYGYGNKKTDQTSYDDGDNETGYGDDAQDIPDPEPGYGDDAQDIPDPEPGYGDDAQDIRDPEPGYGDDPQDIPDPEPGYGDDTQDIRDPEPGYGDDPQDIPDPEPGYGDDTQDIPDPEPGYGDDPQDIPDPEPGYGDDTQDIPDPEPGYGDDPQDIPDPEPGYGPDSGHGYVKPSPGHKKSYFFKHSFHKKTGHGAIAINVRGKGYGSTKTYGHAKASIGYGSSGSHRKHSLLKKFFLKKGHKTVDVNVHPRKSYGYKKFYYGEPVVEKEADDGYLEEETTQPEYGAGEEVVDDTAYPDDPLPVAADGEDLELVEVEPVPGYGGEDGDDAGADEVIANGYEDALIIENPGYGENGEVVTVVSPAY